MEDDDVICVKCVLLGESAVGKSSLINRFINDTFKKDSLPTLVGCYSTKEKYYEKYNQKIKFEIWDTAGQEKYRAINKIFYQDAFVTLLVYDITQKDSYEALKDYWYNEVKEYSPNDVIIVVIGNKSDLYEHEQVDENEVKEFCNSINVLYKQTSAQTGEGVNELFEAIGLKILESEEVKNTYREKIRSKSVKIKTDWENNFSNDANTNTENTNKNKKKCC